MTVKLKISANAGVRRMPTSDIGPYQTPAWTTAERLQRIEAMGQRITDYVQFICRIDGHNGASAEAKDKAIIAFYEQMVIVEHQLSRIQHEFKLV